jgi:uncharacterized protein YbbC (DUF1343 family)
MYSIDVWINQDFSKLRVSLTRKKGGRGNRVAGKHCSKGDKMTIINVTSEYGKTDNKKRECERKLKQSNCFLPKKLFEVQSSCKSNLKMHVMY